MQRDIADRFDAFEALLTHHATASVEQARQVNARLAAIEAKVSGLDPDKLHDVQAAAATLVDVAKTYELAGHGAKVMKILAGLAVTLAGAWAALRHMVGLQPLPPAG